MHFPGSSPLPSSQRSHISNANITINSSKLIYTPQTLVHFFYFAISSLPRLKFPFATTQRFTRAKTFGFVFSFSWRCFYRCILSQNFCLKRFKFGCTRRFSLKFVSPDTLLLATLSEFQQTEENGTCFLLLNKRTGHWISNTF